ncbi:hypothetical protein [Methylocystis parvus]|uniref:hypothetical protein n=1 Tax=Methylocystis parvus TaxID=134 RepID=UPI003C75559D
MTRGQLIWNILLGVISGPTLAALILLVPFGVLTGVSAALDPSLAMYEFTPEQELLVPFILIAGLISAANVRLAVVMSRDKRAGRIFEIATDAYAGDPSGEENMHGHPGKQLAEEFARYLGEREGDALQIGDAEGEDYGWGFWIGEKGFSPLWVAVAHFGPSEQDETKDDYVLAVTLEPPVTPWRRLVYKPDFALRDRVEDHLAEFLAWSGLRYATEAEDWVDPEPKTHPAARF